MEVREIASDLQGEIAARHADMGRDTHVLYDSRGDRVYEPAFEQVFALKRVNPHLPIAWPDWPDGAWPKAMALAQKIVRRLLRWYIDPLVEQQNAYNAEVADTLAHLHARSQAQEEALTALLGRLAEPESAEE